MSVVLFTSAEDSSQDNLGRAVLAKPWNTIASVVLDTWTGFADMNAIIAGISMQEQTNHKFTPSLGSDIFMYVFGDQMGRMSISGLAFYDNCVDSIAYGEHGISRVLRYYRDAKVSNQPNALTVTFQPGVVLQGYMTGMSGSVANVEQQLFQFQLDFALVPGLTLEQRRRGRI